MKATLTLRVVGVASNRREIVSYKKAAALYAAADPAIRPELPAFLGAFTYPTAMLAHVQATGSTRDYTGPVGVPELRFDIDDDDLEEAGRKALKLARYLSDRYTMPTVWFSGGKGFHLDLATGNAIRPAPENPRIAKTLANRIADDAGVAIDGDVYDAVRLWRAPNSRHHRTGLFKVIIPDPDALVFLDLFDLRGRGAKPIPCERPAPAPVSPRLLDDWRDAASEVQRRDVELRDHRAERANGAAKINPLTWALIREPESIELGGGGHDGTFQGRHKAIFSAAANLMEFGSIEALIHGLLHGPGRDTGLAPDDVARQIRCGIEHTRRRQRHEEETP
jgi:hypothetical protein